MHAHIDTQPTLDFESIVKQGDLCTFNHAGAWRIDDLGNRSYGPCSAFALARVTRTCGVVESWCYEALEHYASVGSRLFCVRCGESTTKSEHFTITPI